MLCYGLCLVDVVDSVWEDYSQIQCVVLTIVLVAEGYETDVDLGYAPLDQHRLCLVEWRHRKRIIPIPILHISKRMSNMNQWWNRWLCRHVQSHMGWGYRLVS